MITEDYVNKEIAKLLKEKGFDEKCDKCYAYFADDDIRCLNLGYPKSAQSLIKDRYPYVTIQMAMKWLREVHNIDITITPDRKENYTALVFVNKELPFTSIGSFKTHKAACEAAIKYTLENLI